MLIEALQKQSGLKPNQLAYLAITASKRYKVYPIEKKSGQGVRWIEHPSRELKAVQRWVNKYLFRSFPIHENATAYKKGTSILENASRHARTSFTLRMDFEDFFPSFSSDSISNFLQLENRSQQFGLTEADIAFVSAISTRNGRLTIGSPSSPVISNAIMYEFDCMISDLAEQNQLIYTRYADDLFVSSCEPGVLGKVVTEIQAIVQNYQHVALTINHGKTAYLSKRYRRSITGLNITSENRISIGRERKRKIKSMVFDFINGRLSAEDLQKLRGLLAFTMDVEIVFIQSLERKYGKNTLDRIMDTTA